MDKHNQEHYKAAGIQPIETMQANMSKEELIGFLKGNIEKYLWRKKSQDASDYEKIVVYAQWLSLVENGGTIEVGKPDAWKALDKLIAKIKATEYGFTSVLAITRGGLIPATYVAHALDIDEVLVTDGQTGPQYGEGANVLIVDDIADSGETLTELCNNVKFEHYTATMFMRYSSIFTPDYVGEEIVDDQWVMFPWETTKSTLRKVE